MTVARRLLALDLHLVEFRAEVGGVHLAHGDELAIDGELEDAGGETFLPKRSLELAWGHEVVDDEEEGVDFGPAAVVEHGFEQLPELASLAPSSIKKVGGELEGEAGARSKKTEE